MNKREKNKTAQEFFYGAVLEDQRIQPGVALCTYVENVAAGLGWGLWQTMAQQKRL